MPDWRDLDADARLARVAELRRASLSWDKIALDLHTSRHNVDALRPLLPVELQAPLRATWDGDGKNVRQRVHALLDKRGDLETRVIADELGILPNSAGFYRYTWKQKQEPPEPEPAGRCPGCGLPVPEGWEGECDLCVQQRNGRVVLYKLIEEGTL